MRYSEVLDSRQESLTGSSARSRGNKDQSGLSYYYITEKPDLHHQLVTDLGLSGGY